MQTIEREIKILSHIDEIEKALDNLGISSKMEIQEVTSVKIGRESHKLKAKKLVNKQKADYVYSKKYPTKERSSKQNENFSNKVEVETTMPKKDFKVIEGMFDIMFSNHDIMRYTIQKKRYKTFMGYNIDICQVLSHKGKSKYYMERFIEVEEVNDQEENRPNLDKLLKFLIPDHTDIQTISCGMRNLNKYINKICMVNPGK